MVHHSSHRSKTELKIYINEGELRQIKQWVLMKQDIETGGDLFGLWIDRHTAVVQFVLGPGKNCRRTNVSFYQDVEYLAKAGEVMITEHGLSNIGQWHSHHRLALNEPSNGDERTVWGNMPQLGLDRFLVFIANIKHYHEVTVNCFLFEIENGRRRTVLKGSMSELPGDSPLRLNENIYNKVKNDAETIEGFVVEAKKPNQGGPPREASLKIPKGNASANCDAPTTGEVYKSEKDKSPPEPSRKEKQVYSEEYCNDIGTPRYYDGQVRTSGSNDGHLGMKELEVAGYGGGKIGIMSAENARLIEVTSSDGGVTGDISCQSGIKGRQRGPVEVKGGSSSTVQDDNKGYSVDAKTMSNLNQGNRGMNSAQILKHTTPAVTSHGNEDDKKVRGNSYENTTNVNKERRELQKQSTTERQGTTFVARTSKQEGYQGNRDQIGTPEDVARHGGECRPPTPSGTIHERTNQGKRVSTYDNITGRPEHSVQDDNDRRSIAASDDKKTTTKIIAKEPDQDQGKGKKGRKNAKDSKNNRKNCCTII